MAEMAVMDVKLGDSKIIWDPNNKDEVAAAKAQFDALTAKGFAAYTVDDKGKKKEKVHKFDKTHEKLILAPALRGG
jgi:hypothetical protein